MTGRQRHPTLPLMWRARSHPVRVDGGEWVGLKEAAYQLGVGEVRLRYLAYHGHLVAALNSEGEPGVTAASLTSEQTWRTEASTWQRLKRWFTNLVHWI
jgi:hypothetical protein